MTDPSMERIVPDELDPEDAFDATTLELHRERYQFAIGQLSPGRILDIACGTGYGSFQMVNAEKLAGSHCTAVDISPMVIAYAQSRYAHQSIDFVCEDSMNFSDELLFDAVVSLETIEHLPDPDSFVRKLSSLLKPAGLLIVSAPVTPSTDGNPYHLSDFSQSGFRKLFMLHGFRETAHLVQVQPYSLNMLRSKKNRRLTKGRKGLWKFYLGHPAVFYSRICSLLKEGFKNKYLTLALRKS